MKTRKGDKIKSILTEKVYEVKAIKDWVVVLESLDGLSQVLTDRGNLKLFYEKVENKENPKNFGLSPEPKPMRSPTYVKLDFL